MKLSVLIPVYNAERYINNCMNSLIYQDLSKQDYEVLIMNDGSTDNTANLLIEYVDKYENIFFYSVDKIGVYAIRNRLLEIARGDFIYFLDADDYIAHNSLGIMLKVAIKNHVEILGFKTKETFTYEKFELNKAELNKNNLKVKTGKEFIRDNRNFRHEIWWYFIKKSFLDEEGIKFIENEYNSDVVFSLELLIKTNKMLYFPVSIHRYLQTPDSISRNRDIDKKYKRIENMHKMIIDYSRLINSIISKDIGENVMISNLKFRRDLFVFFSIIKMTKYHFNIKQIRQKIDSLKHVGAYPINNFIGYEYNSFKYKFLNSIINNEAILFKIIFIRIAFFKILHKFGFQKKE